ncbi:MAG: hypothetical protein HYY95_18720 [Candidatus Rokubacteria bacterium]|nr:hypothetical protein [Candidatus Rokubacteria bacterium]
MEPTTGISTPRVPAVRSPFSQAGMLAKYRSRIEAWKSMKATMERGKCETAYAVTPRSAITRMVAGTGRDSSDVITRAP